MAAADRFWAKVVDQGDCWEWIGAKQPNVGYGRFNVSGNFVAMAHRWAYETMISEIPEGLVIDHLCRNAGCVNPYHLEPVPQRENVRRGNAGAALAARRRAITHCARAGHELAGSNLYVDRRGRRSCRECARVGDRERKRRKRQAERGLQ